MCNKHAWLQQWVALDLSALLHRRLGDQKKSCQHLHLSVKQSQRRPPWGELSLFTATLTSMHVRAVFNCALADLKFVTSSFGFPFPTSLCKWFGIIWFHAMSFWILLRSRRFGAKHQHCSATGFRQCIHEWRHLRRNPH